MKIWTNQSLKILMVPISFNFKLSTVHFIIINTWLGAKHVRLLWRTQKGLLWNLEFAFSLLAARWTLCLLPQLSFFRLRIQTFLRTPMVRVQFSSRQQQKILQSLGGEVKFWCCNTANYFTGGIRNSCKVINDKVFDTRDCLIS